MAGCFGRKNDLRNNTCIQTCPVGYFGLDGEIKEGGRPRIGGTCERCLGIGRFCLLDVGVTRTSWARKQVRFLEIEGDFFVQQKIQLTLVRWFINTECKPQNLIRRFMQDLQLGDDVSSLHGWDVPESSDRQAWKSKHDAFDAVDVSIPNLLAIAWLNLLEVHDGVSEISLHGWQWPGTWI